MTLTNANRILEKLGFPALRRANSKEQSINEYGDKYVWAIDNGPRQACYTFPTLTAALIGTIENHWETFDGAKLTAIERRDLRAIPSNVARLI